jgi:phage repressor protein C with HTH and peptisase S24 domain
MMRKMDDSNRRLREARAAAGFKSARAAALRFGWTVSTYASHENGQTGVPPKAAKRYAKAFKTSAGWILTGEGPVNQSTKDAFLGAETDTNSLGGLPALHDNSVNVPEIDVRAGASYAGGFNQEETTIDEYGNSVSRDAIRASWGIPAPFLRDELHIRPGRAHMLPIRGDSMNDVLFDGDRAIINLDDTDLSQGGIFALLDDQSSLIIKQVELVRGKGPQRIKCTSRNPVYAPFELVLDDPVRIIGRVASKITRL